MYGNSDLARGIYTGIYSDIGNDTHAGDSSRTRARVCHARQKDVRFPIVEVNQIRQAGVCVSKFIEVHYFLLAILRPYIFVSFAS